ncbi:MAG: hypothetical protein E7256_05880 [Lachnospiraceae bacterium]|nr:hypothetical protein [Lachnospiraceae bacterium]
MNHRNTENKPEEVIVDMQEKETEMKFKKPGKKTLRRVILGAVLAVVLVGGGAFAVEYVEAGHEAKAAEAAYTITLSQAQAEGTTVITMDEAKQIAFEAAGVTEADVRFLETQLDLNQDMDDRYDLDDRYDTDDRDDRDSDNGKMAYEIEFRYNGLEYDFEIDAKTGDILSYEVD